MQSPAIQADALFLCHQIGGINMADNKKSDMPDKAEQSALDNMAQATPPDLTTEEAAVLAHEGEAVLRDIGEEQL